MFPKVGLSTTSDEGVGNACSAGTVRLDLKLALPDNPNRIGANHPFTCRRKQKVCESLCSLKYLIMDKVNTSSAAAFVAKTFCATDCSVEGIRFKFHTKGKLVRPNKPKLNFVCIFYVDSQQKLPSKSAQQFWRRNTWTYAPPPHYGFILSIVERPQ
jgi:hypothetical protein